MINIDDFADKSYDFCLNKMGWSRHWTVGGCYLHLEASEFIEALRGKGDPVDELGDVLMVLLSVARHYKIDIHEAIKKSEEKMERMSNGRISDIKISTLDGCQEE